MSAVPENTEAKELLLDLGCGKNKQPGFLGVDQYAMDGVDVVHDLRVGPWPWADNSVDRVHCSHFLEHLTNFEGKWERVLFFNELHRIMKPGATAQLIFPHWCSNRYYGDPTHKEPFSEMGFYYLTKSWRVQHNNAPHADIAFNPNGYSCDFEFTYGYNLHPGMANRHQDYVMHAMTFWKETCTDIVATLTKPAAPR